MIKEKESLELKDAVIEFAQEASFDDLRRFMGQVIRYNPNSGALWDLITCLRGPDSPSERPDQSSEESAKAYAGRRERKRRTVEVIRENAFFGVVGGAARHRPGKVVQLPPRNQWDHFDRHVQRAASVLGLEVEVGREGGK